MVVGTIMLPKRVDPTKGPCILLIWHHYLVVRCLDWAGFVVARAFAVHLVVGNCSDAVTLNENEVEEQSCRYDDTAD